MVAEDGLQTGGAIWANSMMCQLSCFCLSALGGSLESVVERTCPVHLSRLRFCKKTQLSRKNPFSQVWVSGFAQELFITNKVISLDNDITKVCDQLLEDCKVDYFDLSPSMKTGKGQRRIGQVGLENQMEVSINGGTPKSSILMGFSLTIHFGAPPFMDPPRCAQVATVAY